MKPTAILNLGTFDMLGQPHHLKNDSINLWKNCSTFNFNLNFISNFFHEILKDSANLSV